MVLMETNHYHFIGNYLKGQNKTYPEVQNPKK